jgi:hypothetical protein
MLNHTGLFRPGILVTFINSPMRDSSFDVRMHSVFTICRRPLVSITTWHIGTNNVSSLSLSA